MPFIPRGGRGGSQGGRGGGGGRSFDGLIKATGTDRYCTACGWKLFGFSVSLFMTRKWAKRVFNYLFN